MKRIGLILFAGLIAAACSTPTQNEGTSASHARVPASADYNQRAYGDALKGAAAQLALQNPQGDVGSAVGASLQGLRGRVQMLVFPKRTCLTEKNANCSIAAGQRYGSPVTFSLNSPLLENCGQELKFDNRKFHHRELFGGRVDTGRDCAVVRVRRTEPPVKAGLLETNEVVAMNIYLDSAYRDYGTDTYVAESRHDYSFYTTRHEPGEGSSSGLSLFPVDLPSPALAQGAVDAPVTIPAEIAARAAKLRAPQPCQTAKRFAYDDRYGNSNAISWCKGDPWPSTIENERFFAVIKR